METWNDNVISWRKGSGKKFRIAVAGDICPARAGAAEICAGKTGEILQSIQPVLDRADLRLAFTMVLQDTWLFNSTIRDNIAYGNPNAPIEDIIQVGSLGLIKAIDFFAHNTCVVG